MAHNTRLHPDSTYAIAYAPPYTDFQTLDATLAKAVNGDAGGTWNPASTITVGGAGVEFAFAVASSTADITTGVGATVTLGDNDFTLYTAIDVFRATQAQTGFSLSGPGAWLSLSTGGIQSNALAVVWSIPLDVLDGSTFTLSDSIEVLINGWTSTPPEFPLKARVVQVDPSGNVTPILFSGSDAEGYIPFSYPGVVAGILFQVPASPLVYNLSLFQYRVEIVEESGTGSWTSSGNIIYAASTHCTATSNQPQ